jgi:alkyldihydroxyacetonephosphate synthase
LRFWGWGEEGHDAPLPEAAEVLLERELDVSPGPRRVPVALENIELPASRLDEGSLASLAASSAARTDREARVLHAAGKSYPDLVRMRSGDLTGAPDAVIAPTSVDGVRDALDWCSARGVAVVPFGGGTSVVGGVEPLRGAFDAVVSLDLRALDRLVAVDERSLTVEAESGLLLPELDAKLAARGLTLGHFPQSYEYATIGGCVATRSAGQASTGYGRIDELVLGLKAATPSGDVDLAAMPASAAGPDLRELLVGSEGAFGVITSSLLRVRPRPEEKRYEGFAFGSFGEGAEAFRVLEQAGAAPDVARLSDEDETRMSFALAGGGTKARAAGLYLRARGVAGGCLAICGWEGDPESVGRRRARTVALLKANGAVSLGQAPGRAWAKGRYHGPYLRDELLARGVFVETLETATQWSGLFTLYRAVGDALRGALGQCVVMCHISHVYPSGASLYFTFLARARDGDELEQWREAKRAASEAIVASGGTITHHHAVGRDHAEWLPAEAGERGIAALRAVKAELDPAGIMNPGKLLQAP